MNKCEYCDEDNTQDMLRGYDGIIKNGDSYNIYIEHYRNEVLTIDNIKYCPYCGRKLD